MTVNEDIHLAGCELAKACWRASTAHIDGVPSMQLRSINMPDGRLIQTDR